MGLARCVTVPVRQYTTEIITLWYRPPEILLGSDRYGPEVDIWSVGAIFGELLLNRPIFKGESETNQIIKIFDFLGTPTAESWPNFASLNIYRSVPMFPKKNLHFIFDERMGDDGIDLFQNLCAYDPSKRLSAKKALNHKYFYDSF